MSFTKGLPHDPKTGLLADEIDFRAFRDAIEVGYIDAFSEQVRHGGRYRVESDSTGNRVVKDPEASATFRQWEAPTAGVAFDLQGPDAQSVTLAPPPPILLDDGECNPELRYEMAEVYEMALLRDEPFSCFESSQTSPLVENSISRLSKLDYHTSREGRPRKTNAQGEIDAQTLFRGTAVGVEIGPYLSQFLLIGTPGRAGRGDVSQGLIQYGAQTIDQRVPVAVTGLNYMVTMDSFVEVQRGLKPPLESYMHGDQTSSDERANRRFITSPRDLATYVHYDALYQAYLNACFILLEMGSPFDPSFDNLSGGGMSANNPDSRRHAGGFALYGGPHILSLLTEVATRALKAVRYQKFNVHRRLRPEALAARLELYRSLKAGELRHDACANPEAMREMEEILASFAAPMESSGTLDEIQKRTAQDANGKESYFLPMAFPEGSPMHPSYGAGHATVAGACVTILKAFFDTDAVLVESPDGAVRFKHCEKRDKKLQYRPHLTGSCLEKEEASIGLTLETELNKLAANISIGRNFAGVHFFSDYFDSLRMGEQVAIGILQEQAITYPTDDFLMTLRTFDGKTVNFGAKSPSTSSKIA